MYNMACRYPRVFRPKVVALRDAIRLPSGDRGPVLPLPGTRRLNFVFGLSIGDCVSVVGDSGLAVSYCL